MASGLAACCLLVIWLGPAEALLGVSSVVSLICLPMRGTGPTPAAGGGQHPQGGWTTNE